jgi:hypothetical protein
MNSHSFLVWNSTLANIHTKALGMSLSLSLSLSLSPSDIGIPNKDDFTKAQALAQLSPQAHQNVKAQLKKS